MAKRPFFGINNKAKLVKKLYFGVGSKAKKVKKGFFGVAGKAKQFYSSGSPMPGIYFLLNGDALMVRHTDTPAIGTILTTFWLGIPGPREAINSGSAISPHMVGNLSGNSDGLFYGIRNGAKAYVASDGTTYTPTSNSIRKINKSSVVERDSGTLPFTTGFMSLASGYTKYYSSHIGGITGQMCGSLSDKLYIQFCPAAGNTNSYVYKFHELSDSNFAVTKTVVTAANETTNAKTILLDGVTNDGKLFLHNDATADQASTSSNAHKKRICDQNTGAIISTLNFARPYAGRLPTVYPRNGEYIAYGQQSIASGNSANGYRFDLNGALIERLIVGDRTMDMYWYENSTTSN